MNMEWSDYRSVIDLDFVTVIARRSYMSCSCEADGGFALLLRLVGLTNCQNFRSRMNDRAEYLVGADGGSC